MSGHRKSQRRGTRPHRLAEEIEFYSERYNELLEKCRRADTLDEKREQWVRAQNCKELIAKFRKQLRACKARCKPEPDAPLFKFNGKEVK